MSFAPRPQENVLYPMPYVPGEDHPFLITNQRLVQLFADGALELPTHEIRFVGRMELRPLLPLAVVLALFGLPLLCWGAYQLYSVWDMEAASWKTLLPREPDPPAAEDAEPLPVEEEPPDGLGPDWPAEVLRTRLYGGAAVAAGALLSMLSLRVARRKRYLVLCRGRDALLQVEAGSASAQTQILMTIQSVKPQG